MRRSILPLVAAVLAVAACSQPEVPRDNYYRLSVAAPLPPAARPLFDGTLEVDRFVADGVVAGRPIVYSRHDDPNQVQEYHYHFWTEPPTLLLQSLLVDYLRGAGLARSVTTPEMRVDAAYAVTGKIKRMEQVVGSPDRAVVELELSVRRTVDDTLLFIQTYQVVEAAADGGVPAAVKAVDTAVAKIFTDFVDDLIRQLGG